MKNGCESHEKQFGPSRTTTLFTLLFLLSHSPFSSSTNTHSQVIRKHKSLIHSPPIIQTEEGPVMGAIVSKNQKLMYAFRSIPFAKPPLGELRLHNPLPVESWSHVLDTRENPNICPQLEKGGIYFGNEDCLFLQVTTPADFSSKAPMPVLVWIYGGAFQEGNNKQGGMYDPRPLVSKHDVIIVQPNYRLGVFGFLAHEKLQDNDEHNSTGNMGIVDQRMALDWVQRNIGHFGGDPNRVTIFGESAGAFSICHHLSNQNYPGLFHAAIMESGSCDSPEFFLSLDVALDFGSRYSASIGCEDDEYYLQCLQQKTTGELMDGVTKFIHRNNESFSYTWDNIVSSERDNYSILDITPNLPTLAPLIPFGPTIDGSEIGLPKMPLTSINDGNFNKVPLIIGTNKDEGSIFIPFVPMIVNDTKYPLRESDLPKVIHHVLDPVIGSEAVNEKYDEILSLYDPTNYKSVNDQAAAIVRDYIFECPSRRAARALSSHGSDVYLYRFDYLNLWPDIRLFGTYNSSEINFVWGKPYPKLLHFFTREDREMSNTFQTYWMNMARLATPNDEGNCNMDRNCIKWPLFQLNGTETIMNMTVPVEIVNQLQQQKQCDFWDEVIGFGKGENILDLS